MEKPSILTVPAEVHWRHQSDIRRDIDRHLKAWKRYRQAVVGHAGAKEEGLPEYQIEEARCAVVQRCQEMEDAAKHLLIAMPTEGRAMVDVLMHLEKYFSILPQAINNQSLALHLIRTLRLSLRRMEKYGLHHAG